MRRVFPLFVTLLVLCAQIPMAHANADRDAVLDISFPVAGPVEFRDTYTAARGGGSRRHQATDLYGSKGQPLHAAMDGVICVASGVDEPVPAYGYVLHLCAGTITFVYSHLNNDSPGTDDNQGGADVAYASGIRAGVSVSRGQLIGFMGDSGNAEDTPPHLHLGIFDTAFEDPALGQAPWRQHYRNPYPSLLAAQQGGSVPAPTLRMGSTGAAVAAWQADLNRGMGAGLVVDGAFGPATDTATRSFQTAVGIVVDGVVGLTTTAAMAEALQRVDAGGPVTQPVGGAAQGEGSAGSAGSAAYGGRVLRLADPMLRGDDVRRWQQQLRSLGHQTAAGRPLAADGIFGPDSDRAARAFQRQQGLTVDGLVGPRTWAAAFAT